MEELFAYAVLMCCGFDLEEEYGSTLDELFLNDPTNSDYLELEILSSNEKESLIYIFSHTDSKLFDREKFGKSFIELLRKYYDSIDDLEKFDRRCRDLWNYLPYELRMEEPFFMLNYAGEPLSWGDFEQAKKLYEIVFNYYRNAENN